MIARKDPRELRAMAFTLADEIETRALPYINAGMTRHQAMSKAIAEMAA